MKKLMALVLSIIMMTIIPISAFAADGFNLSIFDNNEDVHVEYDEMTGDTTIQLKSGSGNIYLDFLDHVWFGTNIYVSDSSEYYNWIIWYTYMGNGPYTNINSALIKIGENRYTFDGIYNSRKDWGDENQYHREFLNIIFDGNSISMMEDLINHKDEDIKIRFTGSNGQFDVKLSSDAIEKLIQMYELYKAAGGTREKNMKVTTLANNVKFTAKIAG